MEVSWKSVLGALILCFLSAQLVLYQQVSTEEHSGSFSLKCPKTMKAEIGDTVNLPCSTDPQTNVIRVEWMVNETTEVHVCRKGIDELAHQASIYKGKTSVFKKELPKGNCSLQLVVSQSHFGTYKCSVLTSRDSKDSCVINLTGVSGKGPSPSPNIHAKGAQINTVRSKSSFDFQYAALFSIACAVPLFWYLFCKGH